MALLILTILFIAGTVALRIGLRGRRIDDHPLCRGCGFDLTGKPAKSWVCAECGADLSVVRAVRIGHRRRLTGWVVGGTFLLLVVLLAAAFDVASQTRAVRLIQYLPVKWLLHEAQTGNTSHRFDALTELLNRTKGGSLNPSQIAATVTIALAVQGDASKPWDPLWGDIIELERGNKQVTDQQWALYAQQTLRDAFAFRVRASLRLGDPLPYWIDQKKGRTATTSGLRFIMDSTSLALPEYHHRPIQSISTGANPFSGGGSVGSAINANELPTKLTPGVHPIHFLGRIRVGEPNGATGVTPLALESLDMTGTVTVLPATQPTVKAVPNSSLADIIQSGLRVDIRSSNRASWESAAIMVDTAPVALSFKVYALFGGKEYELGSFACPAGTSNAVWGMQFNVPSSPSSASSQATTSSMNAKDHVTIILRSDASPAINSTGVFDYWQGEIKLKDVVVRSY